MTDVDPERPVVAEPPRVADGVPEADALEQQAPVTDEDAALPGAAAIEPETEADLADIDEQRRAVPIADDELDRG